MTTPSMIETSMTAALSRFLDVDVARYKLITKNLANIDTPGYHTEDLDFRTELRRAAMFDDSTSNLSLASYSPAARPVRGLLERPDGNNVSVERESLLLAENQLRFQAAAAFLKSEFHRLSLAINGGSSS